MDRRLTLRARPIGIFSRPTLRQLGTSRLVEGVSGLALRRASSPQRFCEVYLLERQDNYRENLGSRYHSFDWVLEHGYAKSVFIAWAENSPQLTGSSKISVQRGRS
jgi:hypothetical protein